jgi:hypothetical protein
MSSLCCHKQFIYRYQTPALFDTYTEAISVLASNCFEIWRVGDENP